MTFGRRRSCSERGKQGARNSAIDPSPDLHRSVRVCVYQFGAEPINLGEAQNKLPFMCRCMRQKAGLFRTHEKVVESFFDGQDKRLIGHGKCLEFSGILDRFFRRFDAKRFCKSGVSLALCTFRDTLELNGFSRHGVGGTGPAGCSLSNVAAWTCLVDDGTARFLFWTC